MQQTGWTQTWATAVRTPTAGPFSWLCSGPGRLWIPEIWRFSQHCWVFSSRLFPAAWPPVCVQTILDDANDCCVVCKRSLKDRTPEVQCGVHTSLGVTSADCLGAGLKLVSNRWSLARCLERSSPDDVESSKGFLAHIPGVSKCCRMECSPMFTW